MSTEAGERRVCDKRTTELTASLVEKKECRSEELLWMRTRFGVPVIYRIDPAVVIVTDRNVLGGRVWK
jgi:hypothetical protein